MPLLLPPLEPICLRHRNRLFWKSDTSHKWLFPPKNCFLGGANYVSGPTLVDFVFPWVGTLITPNRKWLLYLGQRVFANSSCISPDTRHITHFPLPKTSYHLMVILGGTICFKPILFLLFGIKIISMPMREFDTTSISPTINIGQMNHNKLTPHAPWYRLHAPFNPCIQLLCENHKSTNPSNSNPRKVGGRREAPTPVNMVSLWIVFVIRKTVNRGLTGKLNWYF